MARLGREGQEGRGGEECPGSRAERGGGDEGRREGDEGRAERGQGPVHGVFERLGPLNDFEMETEDDEEDDALIVL